MKRKIGELRNKPIVEGDKNLVTKDEVHIDELKNNGEGGSGGGELEGEYYLARPNGWYWKYVGDKIITPDNPLYDVWVSQSLTFLACDGLYSVIQERYYELPFVWEFPESVMISIKDGKDINFSFFVGYAEKAITYSGYGLIGESLYEMLKTASGIEMSEEEFTAIMLSNYGLQRITKEEYESLITA